MKAYDYDSLCETINTMPAWKAAAICAASAEKVAPIVRAIGLPKTWNLAERCIEHAWSSLGQTNALKGQELLRALKATPEWGSDDLSEGRDDFLHLPFAVTKALDFMNFALLASMSISPSEQATRALSLLLDVTENFDTATADFPDAQTVQALGIQLRKSEQLSQQRLVASLESAASPSSGLVKNLREESRTLSEMVERLLPIYGYCYLRG